MSPASDGAVQTIATLAPTSVTALRRATDTPEPINACSTSVSALRRDSSSPTRLFSKKLDIQPDHMRVQRRRATRPVTRSLSRVMQK